MSLIERRERVFSDISDERWHQIDKWGDPGHPDGTGSSIYEFMAGQYRGFCDRKPADKVTWLDILLEEVYEALAETGRARLRGELVQVGAVVTAWIEDIDRRA